MGHFKVLIIIIFFAAQSAFAVDNLRSLSASEDAVRKDLKQILRAGNLVGQIQFDHIYEYGDYARFGCTNNRINIKVYSLSKEWSATFYYALQKLGFLFPHPRMQITPTSQQMRKMCGKKVTWKPALKYRGFHLHTLHPNEWVKGFLEGHVNIALDTIRWLARNQQNIFDLSLLRMPSEQLYKSLKEPFQLAKSLGIHAGIAFGIAFHQQNSFKLVSVIGAFSDDLSRREIARNLNALLDNLDISFLNVESGTSEFTPVNYERTIQWFNQITELAKKKNVKVLNKIHISSNQTDKKYGNFNFLPQFADKELGVLPHTVFYYSLNDQKAPMYGNKNFHHMRDFMLEQKQERRTWFYPETSYWVAMDIGLPLYFLDYLRGRAADMAFLYENKIEGQLNFTTGHELGYWLFDWTVALLNNTEFKFDPLTALKLLGEDPKVFQEHLDFQYKYMTQKQLVSILTFPNLGDEIFPEHSIHNRDLIRDLVHDKNKLEKQVFSLATALNEIPDTSPIKNDEIKTMLTITYNRIRHALYTRKALIDNRDKNLKRAKEVRKQTQVLIDAFIEQYNRYPQADIFSKQSNLTSYQWGYGYTAKELHFWKREEMRIKDESYNPFFMNLYDIFDIVF